MMLVSYALLLFFIIYNTYQFVYMQSRYKYFHILTFYVLVYIIVVFRVAFFSLQLIVI